MNVKQIFIFLALAGLAPLALAGQGDEQAVKEKLAVCATCHGEDGNSIIPVNPSLAGQNYSYLVQAMKDYRSGARNNPIMQAQAAALKDEDITGLARYFSSQPGKLVSLPKHSK